jgi:hypothetical protein
MTPRTPDWAARKATYRSNGRGRQRLSSAINARRGLNLPARDREQEKADRLAVNVPSYAYLLRPHD